MIRVSEAQALVVDGDDNYRNKLCDALIQLGFNVLNLYCATTPGEAMEILDALEKRQDPPIDLIFIEARLEAEGSGYSVCSVVQRCQKLSIPVYLTAFVNDFGPIRAMSIRMQGFLKKPFNQVSLKMYIDRWLKSKELEHSFYSDCTIGCTCDAGSG